MTVNNYRDEHPLCEYCIHRKGAFYGFCPATRKKMKKHTAKRCPCFWAETYELNKKTAFEHIKNMDIESLAMFIAMDRKKIIEDALAVYGINRKLSNDSLYNDFSALIKYLESERGE